MVAFTFRNVYLLLLAGCCVTLVNSLKKNRKETFKEIDETFNEIEKNHHKLKQVFEDILTEKEAKEEQNYKTMEEPIPQELSLFRSAQDMEKCQCLPYYLCNPETGEQVTDGSFLLQSRIDSFQCLDRNEVCCYPQPASAPRSNTLDLRPSAPRMKSLAQIPRNSGYGYSGDRIQQVPNDTSLSKFAEFPWTVLINKANTYVCTGSLIHPKVVLTSAHCVNTSDVLTVRAGEWNTRSKTEPLAHQNRRVMEVIKHPNFRLDNLIYDVALLILEEEFLLQENINTVLLTNAAPDPLITRPDECVVTGWGKDKPNTRYSRIMKKLFFSLLDYPQCQQGFRSTRLGSKFLLHQTFICASGHDGSDACDGYGGAPLVCPMAKQPNRYQQVGIVSWGIGCAEGPSVFTKISQIRPWIDKVFDDGGYNKMYCAD